MKKSYMKEITCDNCNIIFKKRIYVDNSKNSKNNYCSKECKQLHNKVVWTDDMKEKLSKRMSGESNPNYNNRWSSLQKINFSNKKIKQYEDNPELRYIVGKSNRDKKFDRNRIDKMHKHRTKDSYHNYNKKLSETTKMKIGIKSKLKFNDDYNLKMREKMEALGYWYNNKDYEWNYYNRISNWIDNMFGYINLPSDFNLVGIFNNKSNKIGYVRDHSFSRRDAYEILLFPEIVRHPANCNIILHSENSSKRANSSISLNDLFDKIKNYDNIKYKWFEHDKCLIKIDLYLGGQKWQNNS